VTARLPRESVECAYCLTVCKIRKVDLLEAEFVAEVICKECFGWMLKRYRKTGIWGPP
jgi:hypothetical protein